MQTGPLTGTANEDNEERVKRYLDAMERGALDEAIEFWAADATNQASGRSRPQSGRQAIAGVLHMLQTAFPDRHFQIDDLFSSGDKVVCRLTVSGTFGATPAPPAPLPSNWVGVEGTELVPASAAGKAYSVKHIHIFRLENGLITDHWAARDDLALVLQLGGMTIPARA
jgi:predicted ester cyclase